MLFLSLLIFIKVAANWFLVTLLFQKSGGKISCKFATSPDILVAKGKNIVADATVLVAILSPVHSNSLCRLLEDLLLEVQEQDIRP